MQKLFMARQNIMPLLLFAVAILGQGGCLTMTTLEGNGTVPESDVSPKKNLISDLSGLWEYHEGEIVYDLLLDHYGNGGYDWKEGRFETLSLSHGQWEGKWFQIGNDREGKFEAQLSEDGLSARGKWWYTRIGKDSDPLTPGGQFELIFKGGS
jgi:hypothetical protein